MKRLFALLISALSISVSTAFAQWQVDGVQIETPTPLGGSVASDGAGGVLNAWRQQDGADPGNVYVQHIDASGNRLWTTNGVAVRNTAGLQTSVRVVSDGAGGAFVAWIDQVGGVSSSNLFVQHVSAAGTLLWPGAGIVLNPSTTIDQNTRMISDNVGGAIMAWCDARNGNMDLFVQHLDQYGATWPTNGIQVCNAAGDQIRPRLAMSPFGDTFVCWIDQRSGAEGIYVQALAPQGFSQWTFNGIWVGWYDSIFQIPSIASTSSGAVVAWMAYPETIHVQRIAANSVQWPTNGVAVCSTGGRQSAVSLSANDAGGVDVSWCDFRNVDPAVYAQRLDSLGNRQWTTNGVLISSTLIQEGHQNILSTAAGAYVVWSDGTDVDFGTDVDIRAQKINAAGATQWGANGIAVCSAAVSQSNPLIVPDGNGGFITTWTDDRAVTSSSLYAERVSSTGEPYAFVVTKTVDDDTPGSLRAAIRQANTAAGAQTISFNIPGGGVQTIAPVSALPIVTDALTIDGLTQPGASPNTTPVGLPSDAQIMVEIDGSQFGSPRGFQFVAPGCTLRGLSMYGIYIPVTVTGANAVIEGNYFGFDAGGQPVPNNSGDAIIVQGANCRIGGATAAARNAMGGFRSGVYVYGVSAAQVYGNYIGVSPDLGSAHQNQIGVWLLNGANGAKIGSNALTLTPNHNEGNIIANDLDGIVMEGTGTVNNMVIGNSIFGSYSEGIDLGNDGPTYNDRNDADSGPNNRENQPDISSITATQISGSMLQRVINVPVYVHLYASALCGGTAGRGNAVTYLGGVVLGAINDFFSFPLAQPLSPGTRITCTATDVNGNTSELSTCVEYQNTGSGSNVVAPLVDDDGNVRGTATFSSVTGSGNTYFANPFSPPVPVSGFGIGDPNDPQIYYDITTNATYGGGIDMCLKYDENNIPGPEANLVLLHYQNSMWANVTTSRDPVNNIICGHVNSLSPFVIGAVTTTGINDKPIPNRFALNANVPNPFNPITTIRYDVPAGGADVNIAVFDVAGRLVRTLVSEHRAAGNWSVQWNGEDEHGVRVASGVYFYRMRAGEFVETRKMVLLK